MFLSPKLLLLALNNTTGRHENPDITLESPLFNNTAIKYRNNPLFFKQCIARNIKYLKDLMIGDQLMGYEEFLNKYGRSADSLLTYNVLYNAIRPIMGAIKRIPNNVIKFCKIPVGDISRKKFLELITDKHTPHSERFWEHKFQFTFEKGLWAVHFEATKEAKLLSLQWKIIHNIYPTNIFLHKIKVKETNLCEECGVLDTIEHLFVECNTVKHIWLEAERIMEQLVGRLP